MEYCVRIRARIALISVRKSQLKACRGSEQNSSYRLLRCNDEKCISGGIDYGLDYDDISLYDERA